MPLRKRFQGKLRLKSLLPDQIPPPSIRVLTISLHIPEGVNTSELSHALYFLASAFLSHLGLMRFLIYALQIPFSSSTPPVAQLMFLPVVLSLSKQFKASCSDTNSRSSVNRFLGSKSFPFCSQFFILVGEIYWPNHPGIGKIIESLSEE